MPAWHIEISDLVTWSIFPRHQSFQLWCLDLRSSQILQGQGNSELPSGKLMVFNCYWKYQIVAYINHNMFDDTFSIWTLLIMILLTLVFRQPIYVDVSLLVRSLTLLYIKNIWIKELHYRYEFNHSYGDLWPQEPHQQDEDYQLPGSADGQNPVNFVEWRLPQTLLHWPAPTGLCLGLPTVMHEGCKKTSLTLHPDACQRYSQESC